MFLERLCLVEVRLSEELRRGGLDCVEPLLTILFHADSQERVSFYTSLREH